MKNIFKEPLFYLSAILILVVGFIGYNLVVSAQYSQTNPTEAFPDGNPAVPLTSENLSASDGGFNFTGPGRNVISLGNSHTIKVNSNLKINGGGVIASKFSDINTDYYVDPGNSSKSANFRGDIDLNGNNLKDVTEINGKLVDELGKGIDNYDIVSGTSIKFCPKGQFVLGGGCELDGHLDYISVSGDDWLSGARITASYPSESNGKYGWKCEFVNSSLQSTTEGGTEDEKDAKVTAHAICAGEADTQEPPVVEQNAEVQIYIIVTDGRNEAKPTSESVYIKETRRGCFGKGCVISLTAESNSATLVAEPGPADSSFSEWKVLRSDGSTNCDSLNATECNLSYNSEDGDRFEIQAIFKRN